jgi:hypothetical protein
LRDIEPYCSREAPNLLTLMRFPAIENWSVDSRRRGTAFVMMICGDVHKQPQIKGGTWTSTLAHRLAIAFGTSAFYGDRDRAFSILVTRIFSFRRPGIRDPHHTVKLSCRLTLLTKD